MTTVKTSTIIAPIPPRTMEKIKPLTEITIQITLHFLQLDFVKNYLTLDNTLRNVDNTLIGRPPECQAQITQILHVRTVNKDVSKRKQLPHCRMGKLGHQHFVTVASEDHEMKSSPFDTKYERQKLNRLFHRVATAEGNSAQQRVRIDHFQQAACSLDRTLTESMRLGIVTFGTMVAATLSEYNEADTRTVNERFLLDSSYSQIFVFTHVHTK